MGLKGLISNYLKSKNESFFKTIPIYKILVANKQNEYDGLRLFREMDGFVAFSSKRHNCANCIFSADKHVPRRHSWLAMFSASDSSMLSRSISHSIRS